jgi:hypothetical protein
MNKMVVIVKSGRSGSIPDEYHNRIILTAAGQMVLDFTGAAHHATCAVIVFTYVGGYEGLRLDC